MGFHDETMVHGGSSKVGSARKNKDEGGMVETWDHLVRLGRTKSKHLWTNSASVRPWNVGQQQNSSMLVKPMIKESMKW
jgi:hypothetical protein